MRKTSLALGASAMALWLAAPALAQEGPIETDLYSIAVETVATGLEHPWALAFLPDGRYLVTERNAGHLRVGTPEGDLSEPVAGTPEVFRYEGETGSSQGGLFDVKLAPDFETSGHIYLSYSKPTERGAAVSIDRAELVETGDGFELAGLETIFEMNEDAQDSSGAHFGGRMAIHPETGDIYLMIGDRGTMARAQDGEDQAGSLLRMSADGSVPDDNPFLEDDEVDDYVYSYGHRNSQGIAFHPGTLELWANEHGPQGGDEINLIEAGNNYGWPLTSGGPDYSGAPIGVGTEMEGMTAAVHIFEDTVAPSGLAFVTGEAFPEWEHDMLHGGLIPEAIMRTLFEDGEVVVVEVIEIGQRVRDVQIADDGAVWVVTDEEDGEVLRLAPN